MRRESRSFKVILFLSLLLYFTSPAFSYFAQNGAVKLVGTVHDPQKAAIGNANISIFSAAANGQESLVTSVTSDTQGSFIIENLAAGQYEIVVQQDNYQIFRTTLKVKEKDTSINIDITLKLLKEADGLTVTAIVNAAEEAFESSQQTNIATREELKVRPGVILPQLLEEEPGVRSSQGSTFYGQVVIRGLTGQRVASLIDSVRFNTSTFTTALEPPVGLIDTNSISQIDLIYGPGSAVYGSDALGGTVNVITDKPIFYKSGWEIHGAVGNFFSSANMAGGGNLKLTAGNRQFSLFFSGFGQRINDLRAGDGLDSHSILTRFLGLSSKSLGDRLQDTGYLNYGTTGKIVVKLTDQQQLTTFYQHSTQRNARPYFVLNGGTGAELADFSPQILDFFYTRYRKQNLGFLDTLEGTFSLNRQRQRFGVQVTPNPVSLGEYRLAKAYGYGLQSTTHIGSNQFITFGGEIYDERITNKRSLFIGGQDIPITGTVPNGTKYTSYGTYLQDTVEVLPGRLRLNGGLRCKIR